MNQLAPHHMFVGKTSYDPTGPIAMLGDSESIFPAQLAAEWRVRGLDVTLVTSTPGEQRELPDGTPIVRSQQFERRWVWLLRRATNPLLRQLERRAVVWFKHQYRKQTERTEPESWEWYWVDHFWESFSRARAALSLRPRFVFGHEVTSYGLAAALCRGVPRILFPWGGDVFNYCETSPFLRTIARYALAHADLIVPASETASLHIVERFGISPERVRTVTWGVDRTFFRTAGPIERAAICAELGIDPRSVVVLNVRRFHPMWGAAESLGAFLQLAREDSQTHFVLLGGAGVEDHLRAAKAQIAGAGLVGRFTLLEGNLSLQECTRAMSVADIFVSLMGRGDMRSSSVLQAAAAGGAPVILEAPEYRLMHQRGFAAILVPPTAPAALLEALRRLRDDPQHRLLMVEQNQRYLAEYEDYDRQMTKLLELIDVACEPYRRRWQGRRQ